MAFLQRLLPTGIISQGLFSMLNELFSRAVQEVKEAASFRIIQVICDLTVDCFRLFIFACSGVPKSSESRRRGVNGEKTETENAKEG